MPTASEDYSATRACNMSVAAERKVIGYFASDGAHLLLDNKACVVTGSQATMQRLIDSRQSVDGFGNPLVMQARKIRFAAILEGLEKGGSYAFDESAYAVFYPLANQHGYALDEERFDLPADHERDQHGCDIEPAGLPLVVISR